MFNSFEPASPFRGTGGGEIFTTSREETTCPYNSAKYEFLFDLSGENTERAFDRFRHRNVFRYRTRTIKAGNVLEVEIFPIWNTQNEVREAKKHTTREAQKNLNDKNAKKKFIRKINANFTEEDLCVTLTYSNGFGSGRRAGAAAIFGITFAGCGSIAGRMAFQN